MRRRAFLKLAGAGAALGDAGRMRSAPVRAPDGQCDCEHWWPWKGRTNCGWSKGQPNQRVANPNVVQNVEGLALEKVTVNGKRLDA